VAVPDAAGRGAQGRAADPRQHPARGLLDGAADGAAAAREIQIEVTGEQFVWHYQYPKSVTGGAPIDSYQLYVPKGESVLFNIHAKDVIHAFWVPAFRLQVDAVPGITTHWRATPDRLGSYPVVCNLLCGLGHSLMRSTVHVVTPERFQSWIASQRASAPAAPAATSSAGGTSG
jgi:cytochrome c oxidase subunit II